MTILPASAYAAANTMTILADRRDLDYSDKIAELYPDAGPLTVLTKKLGKQSVSSTQFNWFEGTKNLRWTAYDGSTNAAAAGDTSEADFHVTPGTAAYFRVGDILKNPKTGEVCRVTVVQDADHLTVIRGYGTTAAVVMTHDDPLVLMGNAYKENDVAGTMRMGQPVKVSNYTQIIRNPVSISNTLDAEKQRTNPKERARLQAKVGIEHLIDIEYHLWFGEANEDLTGTDPLRMMGGVMSHITSNKLDLTSTYTGHITLALLEEFAEMSFAHGSSTKYLFAAPKVISCLDLLLAGKLQLVDSAEMWNVTAKEFTTSHGTIRVIRHPLFEGAVWGQMGVLLDLNVDGLGYVSLEGRDTKLRLNIGAGDRDGKLDEYLTECSLRFPEQIKHSILSSVSDVA